MATDWTLANALAYVAITDSHRCMHWRVRHRAADFHVFRIEGSAQGRRFYHLTEEGWALARRSRLWKAHEQLTALGFELSGHRPKPGFLHYAHKEGGKRQPGYICHGRAYAQAEAREPHHVREQFDRERHSPLLVGEHKNG